MCHESCTSFIARNLIKEDVVAKRAIEIGSLNVNGTVRPIVQSLGISEYIGIDFREGKDVDIICDAENIVEKFGKESFDIVISTNFLEHSENWKKAISNIKNICKKRGIMLHTTVSKGYGLHEYPSDFWRYELSDMENIFSDCIIQKLEKDTQIQGVFIRAIKPSNFIERDLSDYRLYNIFHNKIM